MILLPEKKIITPGRFFFPKKRRFRSTPCKKHRSKLGWDRLRQIWAYTFPATPITIPSCSGCCTATCDCTGCPTGNWTQYTFTIPPGTITNNFGDCDCSFYNGSFTLVYAGSCTWVSTALVTQHGCSVLDDSFGKPVWTLIHGPTDGDTWELTNADNTLFFDTKFGTNTNCMR